MNINRASIAIVWAACVGLSSVSAGQPRAIHPTASDAVYQTIPYFKWEDAAAYPYLGTYQIHIAEDASFKRILDEDWVPACISHYSPTVELEAGHTYYWQVRYADSDGQVLNSSGVTPFTIRKPAYVVDVAKTDTYDGIIKKLEMAKANAGHGALFRFPPNHTFHLTQRLDDPKAEQEPGEGVLLNVAGASNLIIDGRGSRILLKALPLDRKDMAEKVKTRGNKTSTTLKDRGAGFFFARQSRHIQVKNLTLDYAKDSIMQFAGQITAIDRAKDTITVKVNTDVYGNFEEMKHYKDVFFLDDRNNQRLGFKGVSYPLRKSWADSARGNSVYELRPTGWDCFEDELKIGHWAVTAHRGGDAFINFNSCEDIVVNNCRIEGCRGRYFVVKHVQPYIRCINNQFVRTQGRIMGAPSGGVNSHGNYAWYENCLFEYTRDDSFHAGGADHDGQQTVLRNSIFRGAFRNTIWMHHDRCWIQGNQLFDCGITGINISGLGLEGDYDTIDVGIIRDNLIVNANKTSFQVHGDAENANKHLCIEGNIVRDNRMNEAFLITHLKDSIFANNRVESENVGWRFYSQADRQTAFVFANSSNVTGAGNTVADPRLDCASWLEIEDSCSKVNVSVTTPNAGAK